MFGFSKTDKRLEIKKPIILQPKFKKYEMMKIYIKSYNKGMNEYIDLDAHIDIHNRINNSVKFVHPYSLLDPKETGIE